MRIKTVNLFFQVIRRGRGAEADTGDIFLVVALQFLGQLGGRADADQQHAGRQGVQGAGMADLEVLFMEMAEGRELDLADHVGRRPPVRLVDGKDDAFRVIRNGLRKAFQHTMGRQRSHQAQGILAMRRAWRPPSNFVSSQVRTMRWAIW